jgi:hypothetical protein
VEERHSRQGQSGFTATPAASRGAAPRHHHFRTDAQIAWRLQEARSAPYSGTDKIEEAASLSRGHRWSEEVALAEMPDLTLAQLIAGAECEDRADAHAEFAEGEFRVSRQ